MSEKKTKPSRYQYPEAIMVTLRKRQGLKPNDKSRDAHLQSLSSETVFRELVTWQFGYIQWTETIFGWLNGAGYSLKARNAEASESATASSKPKEGA